MGPLSSFSIRLSSLTKILYIKVTLYSKFNISLLIFLYTQLTEKVTEEEINILSMMYMFKFGNIYKIQ